jgi:hypothetical protein
VQEKASVSSLSLKRVFIRTVLRRIVKPDLLSALYQNDAIKAATMAVVEAESVLESSVAELARLSKQSGGSVDWAHIFVSMLPPLPLQVSQHDVAHVAATLRAAAAAAVSRHAEALRHAAVAEWTIRLRTRLDPAARAESPGWRVTVSLPSGALPMLPW